MSSNEQRGLTDQEIACVSGADGTTTGVAPGGPYGDGCTPGPGDIFPWLDLPRLPTLQDIIGATAAPE